MFDALTTPYQLKEIGKEDEKVSNDLFSCTMGIQSESYLLVHEEKRQLDEILCDA